MIEKTRATIHYLAANSKWPKEETDPGHTQEMGKLLDSGIHKTCPCNLCRLKLELEKKELTPRDITDKIDVMKLNFPPQANRTDDKQSEKRLREKSLIELADIILLLEIKHATDRPNYCEQLLTEYERKLFWVQKAHNQFKDKHKK